MVNPTVRQIIIFSAIKNGEIIDLGFQTNTPADIAIPLPNDEVLLPLEVSSNAGFPNRVFMVVSRRFVYDNLPSGIGGVVSLTLKHESNGS